MAHGRYTILGKLADGGMAEIFLATQHGAEGFQKPVVLKRVLTAFSADPQFRNMFLDEAHISMTLSHGNIVQVLDVGVAGERTFLVLELVEGWDLEQLMERAQATGPDHPWPPSLALYVTAQICRGLSYAHGKRGPDGRSLGIVHRDVSPNNVLISEQGEVKLADFGIAKAESKRERTLAGVIKGKIGFMSPEQALGRALDARADLFSVGTVLYLMLTGRRPFYAASELESMMLAQRAEYQPPEQLNPYLSPEATAIVSRAMQREPGSRYQTADQMLVDVERVLRSQYHSAGQTELKLWLAELARRDGVPPIGRARLDDGARPEFVDEAGDLSAGSSLELSDIDHSAAAAAAAATTAVAAMTVAARAIMASGAPPNHGPKPVPMPPAKPTGAVRFAASSPAIAVAPNAEAAPGAGGGSLAPGEGPATGEGGEQLPARHSGTQRAAAEPVSASGLSPAVRLPRRSRVGLGFALGAVCMLGAVFGIRWLAQWAGRERVGIPGWYQSASDAGPAAVPDAPPAPPPAPRTPGESKNVVTAAPAEAVLSDASAGSGPGGTASGGTDANPSPKVLIDRPSSVPPVPSSSPSSSLPTEASEDDEDRLLGRVVPDPAAVIGEDEAEDLAPANAPPGNRKGSGKGGTGARSRETSKSAGRASRTSAENEKTGSVGRSPPTPARAQPVQIRITTAPLGAVVRTKKHVLGRTPLAIRFNPGSTYELTFVKSGYVTNSRRLSVLAGKPKSISVAMKKLPAPARHGLLRGR